MEVVVNVFLSFSSVIVLNRLFSVERVPSVSILSYGSHRFQHIIYSNNEKKKRGNWYFAITHKQYVYILYSQMGFYRSRIRHPSCSFVSLPKQSAYGEKTTTKKKETMKNYPILCLFGFVFVCWRQQADEKPMNVQNLSLKHRNKHKYANELYMNFFRFCVRFLCSLLFDFTLTERCLSICFYIKIKNEVKRKKYDQQ